MMDKHEELKNTIEEIAKEDNPGILPDEARSMAIEAMRHYDLIKRAEHQLEKAPE